MGLDDPPIDWAGRGGIKAAGLPALASSLAALEERESRLEERARVNRALYRSVLGGGGCGTNAGASEMSMLLIEPIGGFERTKPMSGCGGIQILQEIACATDGKRKGKSTWEKGA